ncbi:S100 calcium binding protein U [Cyclopterus lumpus]|uniref:S100 calcium binding protein U n=1 Tax=Cyclopterus lumpus TaxID=8103 RepID=A0A8C2ZZF9_CYCLU|nr:S100 calcium binding protein U [Cyclopterus lumpus]
MEPAIQTMVKVFMKSAKGKESLGQSQFQSLVKSQLSNILSDTDSKEAVKDMGQGLDANQDGKVGFEEYLKLVGYLAVSLSEQRDLAKEQPAQNAASEPDHAAAPEAAAPDKEEKKPEANAEAKEEATPEASAEAKEEAKPEANNDAKVEADAEAKVEENGGVTVEIKSEGETQPEAAKEEEKKEMPALDKEVTAAGVVESVKEEMKVEIEKVEEAVEKVDEEVEKKIEEGTS